jgi:hypothetical protein
MARYVLLGIASSEFAVDAENAQAAFAKWNGNERTHMFVAARWS